MIARARPRVAIAEIRTVAASSAAAAASSTSVAKIRTGNRSTWKDFAEEGFITIDQTPGPMTGAAEQTIGQPRKVTTEKRLAANYTRHSNHSARRQRPDLGRWRRAAPVNPTRVELWAAGRYHSGSVSRSEQHTSELQSRQYLVCRLLL